MRKKANAITAHQARSHCQDPKGPQRRPASRYVICGEETSGQKLGADYGGGAEAEPETVMKHVYDVPEAAQRMVCDIIIRGTNFFPLKEWFQNPRNP